MGEKMMNKKVSLGIFSVYCIFCIFSLAAICWHHHMFSVTDALGYLGGPASEAYSPVEVMWWLVIFIPVWVGCGFALSTFFQYGKMQIYRCKSFRGWWFKVFVKMAILNLFYFALFIFMLNINHMFDIQLFKIVMLLMFHSLFMTAVMIWIFLLTGNIIAAFCSVLILEALATIFIMLGINPCYNPLVWGMFRYNEDIYSTGGYHIISVTIVQLIIFIGSFCVPAFFKKILMHGVSNCS